MRTLLGLDRRKIAYQQTRLQRSLAIQYRRPLAAEIQRAFLLMVNGLRSTNSVPYLPPDHERRLEGIYQAMAETSIAAFGERILNDSKARGYHDIERKSFADFFQRLAMEFVRGELIRRRITAVAETTRAQIVRLVARGQDEGQGIDEIAANLERVSSRISRTRGALIARTETHNASNFGAHEAAKATGLVLMKEWVSVQDTRIRDFNEPIAEFDHRRMDGVTVAMDASFLVPRINGGREPLLFPGDAAGSPANTINCRCQSVHIIPD